MLLVDEECPRADWSDQDIVRWARSRGYGRQPKESFILSYTVHPHQPNAVEIDWTQKPPCARRYVLCSDPGTDI